MDKKDSVDLNTEISKITKLSKEHVIALKRLKLFTINDLLNYLPSRYADERENKNINNLKKGEAVILFGELKNLNAKRSFKGHVPYTEAKLVDATGSIRLIWFHQAYISKMYEEGEFVKVSGIIQEKDGKYSLLNPSLERVSRDHIFYENNIFENINKEDKNLEKENKKINSVELVPVYKETLGLTSNYIHTLIKRVIVDYKILDKISDPLPENILKEFHLPDLAKSYLYLHLPKGKDIKEAENFVLAARKRFSFQEIFFIQIIKQIEKAKAKNSLAYKVSESKKIFNDFIKEIENNFGFKLTSSQLSATLNILEDLKKDEPMGRLLEGDVGSGKTLVAIIVAYIITHDINRDKETRKRLQVAYMAPTEVLASQHFESFIKFLGEKGIEIGLITSKTCKKFPSKTNKEKSVDISKNQLKKWIETGDISIVIGTHSLLNEKVKFQNLALAIIDEQHRFGVKQRATLANKKSSSTLTLAANDIKNLSNKKQKIILEKNKLPHLLSMTATPIPRTLALTIFGDLDLTVIDELPKDRKKIITKLSNETNRDNIYKEIKDEIKAGYQAYVIVPRIEELDDEDSQNNRKLNLRSVESEIKNLRKYFGEKINIFGIHSKLKKEEKEKIMKEFYENKIQILVSTSVVEVGVNVPNASRMIIEGGERFGLAQLHQLRGRIGRGERESVCYIFSNGNSEITSERLSSLIKAKNGFELAELDLSQRGIGSLLSGKQWGVSDLAMEAIKNLKLVEVAREEAKKIIEKDPELNLSSHKILKNIILEKEKAHME